MRIPLRLLRPLLVAAALAWAPTRATAAATSELAPSLSLTLAVLVALATYLAAVSVLDRSLLAFAWRQARRALGRTATAGGQA